MTSRFLTLLAVSLCWPVYASSRAASGELLNGVGIYNADRKAYRITYGETTRICNKRGAGGYAPPLASRPGFEILERKIDLVGNATVTAEIQPGARVNCLCVRNCEIRLDNRSFLAAKNENIIIKGGLLKQTGRRK